MYYLNEDAPKFYTLLRDVGFSELEDIKKMNPFEFNRWLKTYVYECVDSNVYDLIDKYLEEEDFF